MKFLSTKELKENSALKTLIYTLLCFFILFLILDLLLRHLNIGLTYTVALATIRGDEEAFIEPILLESLLLIAHMDLFFSMILLLILTSIQIRLSSKKRVSKTLIHALSITALMAPIALLLAYFTGLYLVIIWIVLFITWHILAILVSLKSIYLVYRL